MADQPSVPSPGYYPDGAPTAYWVDCIWIDKVFGSCQKVVTANGTGTAPISCTTLTTVTCGTPTCAFLNSVPSTNDYATLSWLVTVPVNYTCDVGSGTVMVTIQVAATIYSPAGTTPACIPFSVSCGANVLNGIVYATVTLCVELKTFARVQLLVPAYGYCEEPPCGIENPCPSPFPPQPVTPITPPSPPSPPPPPTPPIIDP